MNPLLDQLAVLFIISGAVGFFARRFWKRRQLKRAGKSCGHDCGCGTSTRASKMGDVL